MLLRRFESAAEFVQRVEPFLMVKEAEHNLMLGLCTMLLKMNIFQQPPYLALVERGGEVVAVALRTPPHNLVLSQTAALEALKLIADDVKAIYPELPGVVGPKAIVRSFAATWQDVTSQHAHLRRAERLFKLEGVNPVSGVSGEYRLATEADHDLLVDWFMAFSAEALDGMTRKDAEREVNQRYAADPALRGTRLWYDGGQPVSFAGYGGPTPHSMRIGPVYTPPEQRGRGYASACVAALSQELLDRGKRFCTLFTDLSNPTSNHIYQMIGYQPVMDVDEYHFESKSGD
jgi:hypothetical protein